MNEELSGAARHEAAAAKLRKERADALEKKKQEAEKKKEASAQFWANLRANATRVKDSIVSGVTQTKEGAKAFYQDARDAGSAVVQGARDMGTSVAEGAKGVYQDVKATAGEVAQGAREAYQTGVDYKNRAVEFVADIPAKIKDADAYCDRRIDSATTWMAQKIEGYHSTRAEKLGASGTQLRADIQECKTKIAAAGEQLKIRAERLANGEDNVDSSELQFFVDTVQRNQDLAKGYEEDAARYSSRSESHAAMAENGTGISKWLRGVVGVPAIR